MSRKAQTPRLSTVDPVALSIDVVERVLERIRAQGRHLKPAKVHVDFAGVDAGNIELADLARRLVTYARTGSGLKHPMEAIRRVADAAGVDETTSKDLHDPIDLVLAAACGRMKLAAGGQLQVRELAAIGEMDPIALRKLAAKGKPESVNEGKAPFLFTAEVARKWIASRGNRLPLEAAEPK